MYGKSILKKENLKYVTVTCESDRLIFTANIGCSLRKASEEVEKYLKEHLYAIQQVHHFEYIVFEYNKEDILINSNWNSDQIGRSWLVNHEVEDEISNMAQVEADKVLKEKQNNQAEEELTEVETSSVKPRSTRTKIAKKQLGPTAKILNKQGGQLELEVFIGISMNDLATDLEKLFNTSGFVSASFIFNGVPVVVKKGMSSKEMIELYFKNNELRAQIIERGKEKQKEIIEKYETTNDVEQWKLNFIKDNHI